MGFVDELFKPKDEGRVKIPVEKNFEKNLNFFKEKLANHDDVIYRDFNAGQDQKMRFATIYAEGLADRNHINQHLLKNLMLLARITNLDVQDISQKIYEVIVDGTVAVTDMKEIDDLNLAVDFILAGETILIFDNWDKVLMIASKGWPMRSVSEPSTETVIRGPSEGFTETLRVNTTLIRRRIRDPRFKLKQIQLGKRSKTDVAVLFIEEIVNVNVLRMVKERLDKIDIDAVLESGYVEQLIEDDWQSPFPQVQHTQRPDTVVAGLYEGRVGLIIDNTPFALLVPSTAISLLQSPEDYYERYFIASAVRVLRFVSMVIALTFPALYIAVTSFHPGMLPTDLALYVAGTRMNVPFPAFIEAFLMEGALELLREAGIRLPAPIGSTIGIVGGLVLGQAAVEAGIVSPLMVIVVALTAMTTYASPSYSLATSFRLMRFILMALSAALGLYGLIIGLFIILAHMCRLKSFGVPYLSPFAAANMTLKDFKDALIRVPLHMMRKRPEYLHRSDNDRLGKMTEDIFSWGGIKMNRNNDQISSAQLAAILSIVIMGIGILTLPRTLVEEVGPDALFVIGAGVITALILGVIISKLVLKFPNETVVEFGNTLLGKFIGTAMSLGFFVFYVVFTAIEVRMFGEIMKTYLLINTPIEILMITYILTVIYVVRSGIEPMARLAQILFPIVLVFSVVVILPMIFELDLTHFLPVLRTKLPKLIMAMPLMIFSFLGLELTLIFSAFVSDKKNITKYVVFSVALIGSIYFTTVLVTIARFGLIETTHMVWPGLELFKTIDIPEAFIENIHIYVVAIWVLSVLMTTAGVFYGATLILSRIIKTTEHNYLALPLTPIIFFIAIFPENLVETIEMMDLFSNYLGTLYLVVVPVGLLGISLFKKKKGGKKSA